MECVTPWLMGPGDVRMNIIVHDAASQCSGAKGHRHELSDVSLRRWLSPPSLVSLCIAAGEGKSVWQRCRHRLKTQVLLCRCTLKYGGMQFQGIRSHVPKIVSSSPLAPSERRWSVDGAGASTRNIAACCLLFAREPSPAGCTAPGSP